MRNEIKMTDAEIDAIFDEEAGIGDFCEFYASYTRDTIDQFIEGRKGWNESGMLKKGVTESGHNFIRIDRAQAVKGTPRVDVVVVDFGTVRAVCQTQS